MNAVKGNYLPHVVMRNSLSIVRVYESSTTWCEFYP